MDVSPSAIAADLGHEALRASPPSRVRTRAAEVTLAEVYREHHRFVWRSLSRLGVGDDRVADAVHDVFMVVARRLDEFEGRASMKTWLFAIAMRVAQGVRRDAARERLRRERVSTVTPGDHEPHARADAARTLRDMLAQLDDDKRAVFVMIELEGMTAPEAAAVLGVKTATVYSRLRLARQRLERVLQRQRAREGSTARPSRRRRDTRDTKRDAKQVAKADAKADATRDPKRKGGAR